MRYFTHRVHTVWVNSNYNLFHFQCFMHQGFIKYHLVLKWGKHSHRWTTAHPTEILGFTRRNRTTRWNCFVEKSSNLIKLFQVTSSSVINSIKSLFFCIAGSTFFVTKRKHSKHLSSQSRDLHLTNVANPIKSCAEQKSHTSSGWSNMNRKDHQHFSIVYIKLIRLNREQCLQFIFVLVLQVTESWCTFKTLSLVKPFLHDTYKLLFI